MKDVLLRIEGIQTNADGEESIIEMVTIRQVLQQANAIYLVYKETELSGMEGLRYDCQAYRKKKIYPEAARPRVSRNDIWAGEGYAAKYSIPMATLI